MREPGQRYLNPIQILQLRVAYLMWPEMSMAEIARRYRVSRPTVRKHTVEKGLDRSRPPAVHVPKLEELWADEAGGIYLSREDFVAVLFAVLARTNPQFQKALADAFAQAESLPAQRSLGATSWPRRRSGQTNCGPSAI